VAHTSQVTVILVTWEAEIGRIGVHGQPGQIVLENSPLHFQIAIAKGTAGVVQAVECLLCKRKILNSNTSPTKKKKVLSNDSEFLTESAKHCCLGHCI
jgi:hypothetical protein